MNYPGSARNPSSSSDERDAKVEPQVVAYDFVRHPWYQVTAEQQGYQEPALIDHEHILRRLRSVWQAADAGQGHLVALVGENGAGRSRLIRELGRSMQANDIDSCWLVAQAFSYATYKPLGLIAELVMPWAGGDAQAAPVTSVASALTVLANGAGIEEQWALLALARDLRDLPSRETLESLPLAAALAGALRRAAGDRLLVLVLEDLEWADALSLRVLDQLLAELTGSRCIVFYTHHADWSHDWPGIARHAQLFLGQLGRQDSIRLINEVAADQPLAAPLVEALANVADGNPLMLEQATLATLAGEIADPASVPMTLQSAIQVRIYLLSPAAREIVFVAAVLGQRFAYRLLAMVTESLVAERDTLDIGLRELVHQGFLIRWETVPEVLYAFRHALLQEVAFSAIPSTERRQLERHVATCLLSDAALNERGVDQVLADLDQLLAQSPFQAQIADSDTPAAAVDPQAVQPLPRNEQDRAKVLARIVLADLAVEQRASIVLCFEHGYSYAAAGEMLGLPSETIRGHIYEARRLFKRLYDASDDTAPTALVRGA